MGSLIKLSQTIVVEGRYDKARLASLFDANIIETGGFSIFADDEKLALIRRLARKDGVILFTDSDAAGFRIRAYLGGALPKESFIHVYLPDIYGKERRKEHPSAEGKLGVEGVDGVRILEAFRKAGALPEGEGEPGAGTGSCGVTMADLYGDGLVGGGDSARKRRALQAALGLPARLSTKGLLQVLGRLYTREQYKEAVAGLAPKEGKGP